MSRIAQKIGLAGALIGSLFASDMAKPNEAEAGGRHFRSGSFFSFNACIGGCFPIFYHPFIAVPAISPMVVSVPYYVPTYPATGAYALQGTQPPPPPPPPPSGASAYATVSAQADLDRTLDRIDRIRKEAIEAGKELGGLQTTVNYQNQRIKDLEDRLARAPTQAPAPPAQAQPVQTPAPPPAYTAPSAPIPRESRAGEIPSEHWMIASAAEGLLVRAGGPETMHGQRFGTADMKETTCYYDAIRREPKPKSNPKDPTTHKYWAVVVGKETAECKGKRLSVLEKNPKLRSNVTVYEFDPSIVRDYGDYATARKAVEAWLDRNKIPRMDETKAPVLAR